MKKNYYDVLVMGSDGLNREVLKNVCYEVANLKVLELRSKSKEADIWYNFDKYATTIITKDNIHLYYEFMSDDDKKDYRFLISPILFNRYYSICDEDFLKNISPTQLCSITKEVVSGDLLISQYIFGVKDTLKPIDEYIAEIKASSECKEYIATTL